MSKKNSPFAALTSREQQERWLEFQNTKLPYITGEVDTTTTVSTEPWVGRYVEKTKGLTHSLQSISDVQGHTPSQQGTRVDSRVDSSMQKTNHKQYDAVIRRMMQAEKQTTKFQSSAL